MNKLWYVYANLCEQSFLSKHVRKNKALLNADFVLALFPSAATSVTIKRNHGRTHTHHFNNVLPKV